MIIHGIILLIVAVLELWLGLYILFRSPRDPINKSFILLTGAILLWVISNALIAFISNLVIVELLFRLAYVGGVFIGLFFLLFTAYFPYRTFQVPKRTMFFIALPSLALSFVLLFSDSIMSGLTVVRGVNVAKLEPLFVLYLIYFLVYFIWTFLILYKKFIRSDGIHRWQLKYVLLSTTIPFAISLVTDVILPWISGVPVAITIFFGSESSIVWLALTAYVAFGKYRLVKVNP